MQTSNTEWNTAVVIPPGSHLPAEIYNFSPHKRFVPVRHQHIVAELENTKSTMCTEEMRKLHGLPTCIIYLAMDYVWSMLLVDSDRVYETSQRHEHMVDQLHWIRFHLNNTEDIYEEYREIVPYQTEIYFDAPDVLTLCKWKYQVCQSYKRTLPFEVESDDDLPPITNSGEVTDETSEN
jgi:hypothetical protein